jgi:hypothetical protein
MIGRIADEAGLELADRHESAVRDAVGLAFRQSTSVAVRRPRWMPDRLYRWLMRTIVVTVGPIETRN